MREVLRRPSFDLIEEQANDLADSYITHCERVTEGPRPEGTPVCRDETDQMLIDAAHRARADALMSSHTTPEPSSTTHSEQRSSGRE